MVPRTSVPFATLSIGLIVWAGADAVTNTAQAQNGQWCQANPERCARLKERIRERCRRDPDWCQRLRARLRERQAGRGAGLSRATLRHDGHQREFLWMVPATARGKVPLVILLHGGRGRARQITRYTRFDSVARQNGFALLVPQGLNRHWNDGRRHNNAVRTDDVGFLRKAATDLARRTGRIDLSRVFVTGISNGGFMSLRMACDASDFVAGIAAVTAQFTSQLAARCRPARPIPVLIMNGTADPLVPYTGGIVAARWGNRGTVQHTDQTVAFWRRHNQCAGAGRLVRLPDRTPGDGVTIERRRWGSCATGAPVVLYRLIGGGHTWPGKRPYLPARIIGRTGQDIDGSAHIWRWFASLKPRR